MPGIILNKRNDIGLDNSENDIGPDLPKVPNHVLLTMLGIFISPLVHPSLMTNAQNPY